MKVRFAALLVLLMCLCAQAAFAWTAVGDGIDYQYFLDSGPNNVFVCRMARANTSATIESCSAGGKTIGGREVMTAQAARMDQAIGYWGQNWGVRNSVVCTINGDYEDPNDPTGVMLGGFVHSGSYDKQYGIPVCGGVGFGWSLNRVPSMPDTASIVASKQIVTYMATAVEQQFQGINRSRGSNELVIYTANYDYNTHADSSGTEVVVRLTTPFLIKPTPGYVTGNVIEIRQGQTGANIPFDCIVLSATGSAATTLANNVSIGAEIHVGQEPYFYDKTCATPSGIDWTKMYASAGGNVRFLRNGVIEHNMQAGMIVRNPRTAICYNATYVFFVVCDGRSVSSVGWTNDEMATFCLNTLGATDGQNLDGGGSSEMVVNGVIKNVPSDGSERAVVNGIMMVNVQDKQQSLTFTDGQQVTTTGSASLRLGPGTNYTSIATIANGTAGTVQTHALNGVLAKSYNWWYVSFPGGTGWVAESLIGGGGGCTPPSITTQPSGTSVNAGQTASFTVAAAGTGLTYQWQKEGVNLTNGGDISGATSTTLQIANCEEIDEGNYRCVVNGSCGQATSNNAWLDVNSGGGAEIILDEDQGTSSGSWTLSTGAGSAAYNGDYKYAITASSETAWYRWTPSITTAGNYDVYIMYRQGTNRTLYAPYTVYYNGGSQGFAINQTAGGGVWNLLGRFNFAAGTGGYVKLGNATSDTGKAVIADAARFVYAGGAAGPTITQQPSAQNVCAGSAALFTVAATGQGTLTYQWQKNQVNLANGGDVSGATSTTLQIANSDSSDAANYRCVVTDSNGSTNSNEAALTIKTATSITSHPQNQSVTAGSTATFTVGATGSGTLSYQWQKNSVNLTNGGNVSGATTATLTITNCQSVDAANYRCIVTGDCGSATSNNATLSISTATTVILDEDQGTSYGSWALSTGAGSNAYNGDYKWANSAVTETAWYRWTPNLTAAGNYTVYVMYRSGSNRPTNARYTIYHNGGSQTYTVNQTINGGTWVLLGTKAFLAGTSGYVHLSNDIDATGKAVIADAVKWVPAP